MFCFYDCGYRNTVHMGSIHSASLLPHFVMLQAYSKMYSINYFLQNSSSRKRERSLFEIFANLLKIKK